MLKKALAISFAVSVLILLILLQATTPAEIGPLGILFIFVLMYVATLSLVTWLIYGTSKLVSKMTSSMIFKQPVRQMELERSYYFATVIALGPVMMIGMQSVDEVGVYEVILILLFMLIACVYISKRSS